MFRGLAGAEDGVHIRVWSELKPWMGSLMPAATSKWLPRIAAGMLCEVPVVSRGRAVGECQRFGVAACGVCNRPCCLHHGFIDQHGDVICYLCVADAQQTLPPLQRERARRAGEKQEPPGTRSREREQKHQEPPPQGKPPPTIAQIQAAYDVLGVKKSATWVQIESAYKRLLAANHPDKQRGPRATTAAEARFKAIRSAYDLLKVVRADAK